MGIGIIKCFHFEKQNAAKHSHENYQYSSKSNEIRL